MLVSSSIFFFFFFGFWIIVGINIIEIGDDVGISFSSCQAIFTDGFGMKRAAAKIVPKLLNVEQKQRRMDITQEMLTTFNDDPDLRRKVITGPR